MKTTRRGFLAAAVATLTATSTHMATNTPNYDFDREDPGADGWTDRMNGNFTDLDTLFSTGSVNGQPIQQLGADGTPTGPIYAENANLGSTIVRPQTTTGPLTLDVTNYADGLELAKDIPVEIRHQVTIDVPFGASRTDILIPPFIGGTQIDEGTAQESGAPINIIGDETNPTSHPVSIYAEGANAKLGAAVLGCEIAANNPYDNEDVGVAAYYCPLTVRDCVWTGGTNGLLSYGANVELSELDFGSGVLTGDAIRAKHFGFAWEQKAVTTPTQGTVGGYAYDPQSGQITFLDDSSTLSGTTGLVRSGADRTGLVYDGESRKLFYTDELVSASGKISITNTVDLVANKLTGIREYNNAVVGDLETREIAIDTNRGGTGNVAVLYKTAGGSLYYVDLTAA